MRQDQYEKLQALTEQLTDAFISEADPAVWPGHGIEPRSMDQQTRGDRYWCKKNAAATLSVIVRTTSLIGIIQMRGLVGESGGGENQSASGEAAEEDGLESDVRAAEKEAEKLLQKLQDKMAKTHGK
jgi:hypothetical protein